MQISTGYHPQAKQKMLHECRANEILYGGAAGPGKSHALRHEGLDWCLRIPGLHVYLFRRTFPELEDNHIIPSLKEFPKEVGKYRDQKHRWEFGNGSMLHFGHCQYDKDVFQYLGSEINLLLVDELTMFTDFMYDFLRGRVRCSLPVPEKYKGKIPGIVCASNPGGVGHAWVKSRWIDYAAPYEIKQAPEGEGKMFRCFIPGKLADNPILAISDPNYIHRLDGLPEPYRTAYKDGNWDIFMGQAFDFSRIHNVCDPLPIPEHNQIYMSFDWGFGAPFSIGWWWADNDGRVYRFSEWYGWNGMPNQGMRMTDDHVADGIKERERALGISTRQIVRYAGPDCFQHRPDYKGGGQGPSTAEVFARHGIFLSPGDADRHHKIKQFRERLQVPKDGSRPMLQVYSTCTQFIRTIPLLQVDSKDVEDIETNSEDHCLHGDTLIPTRQGNIPIRNLIGTKGEIFTVGDKRVDYENCRKIKVDTEIVKVLFEDGSSLICTPDHEILTSSGLWKKAVDITDERCYVSIHTKEETLCRLMSLAKRSKSLMGNGTIFVVSILGMMANFFIERFGSLIMGLFQKVTKFTTKIEINLKTKLRILSQPTNQFMLPIMPRLQIIGHGLNQYTEGQINGMAAKREGNGTKNIIKNTAKRSFLKRFMVSVFSVEKDFTDQKGQNIVQENVNRGHGLKPLPYLKRDDVNFVSNFSKYHGPVLTKLVHSLALQSYDGVGLKVVKVQPLGKSDVYCLTVPKYHCFKLTNNIVVTNCYDEACHIVMARPRTIPFEEIERSRIEDQYQPLDPVMGF